jgi:predicted RNase H-like HicB family nuclease
MLCRNIEAAMRLARYEVLEGGEGVFGSIPPLKGVWANESTLEACRTELISALEDWLVFKQTAPCCRGSESKAASESKSASETSRE